jgi:hypothetical protein
MSSTWWGKFEFSAGETRHWVLGPLSLWITRSPSEFRIATIREPLEEFPAIQTGALWTDPVPESAHLVRYGVRESVRHISLLPVTGDRAAIIKSETPYIVPPGGATTAFVSSPVWLQLRLPKVVAPFHEDPTLRPSDTWFGPSTIVGELCYAIRTSVRYNLENVPVLPYRAVSVIRIQNHANSPLELARLRLPMPFLSLFKDADGRLWTESVTLDRLEDGDVAEVKLGDSAPREAGRCSRVSDPRFDMGRKHLIRSFTGLLGLGRSKESFERVVE